MAGDLHQDHQDLLQFLYQLPIGVLEMSESGAVVMMNPKASMLLSTEAESGESPADPLPMLRRLVPNLFEALDSDPEHLGIISTGRGEEVDSRDGQTRFTVTVHRLRQSQIIVALTDVTEERRLFNEQRARANRLQKALLGTVDPTAVELSVAYLPANRGDLSGGDWYDVIDLKDGRTAFVVGDVVGHDIEASATMGQLRAIVRAFARTDPEPSKVLSRTEDLARTIERASFATISYLILDGNTSSIRYASAGHPPPLVVRSDGSTELLLGGRRPVLAALEPQQYEEATTKLEEGDVVVLYTDGLVERRSEPIDEGLSRLQQTAASFRPSLSVNELVDGITKTMLAGSDHDDDVCVLAFRHAPADR